MGGRQRALLTVTLAAVLQQAAGVRSQDAQGQQARTGVVIGRVIDADTGKSVSGAVVTLGSATLVTRQSAESSVGLAPLGVQSLPGDISGRDAASTLRVLTDAQGRFAFLDLPSGTFGFKADARGYVGGRYGQRRPDGEARPFELAVGQAVDTVTLPVWRAASLSGAVVDEAGEPIVRAAVRLLKWSVAAGRRRLVPSGALAATTDDRGAYRFASVMPGDYVVGVPTTTMSSDLVASEISLVDAGLATGFMQRSPGATVVFTVGTVNTPASGRSLGFPSTFHPSARTPAESTTVALRAGEDRTNVNITLRLTTAVRVSGAVTNSSGRPFDRAQASLMPAGFEDLSGDAGFEAGLASFGPTGVFSFTAIPSGAYVLRTNASSVSAFSSVPIVVGNSELSGVVVDLRPGARIAGRLVFEGAVERLGSGDIAAIRLVANSADGAPPAGFPLIPPGPFNDAGRIQASPVPPGNYVLSLNSIPSGWALKSAIYDGRDISVTPVDVGAGDIDDVVFTLTDRTSQISGSVRSATNGAADAAVLLFPAEDSSLNDPLGRRTRRIRTADSGAYSFVVVPPGDYYVVAVSEEASAMFPEQQFLRSLRGVATHVRVAEGDDKTLDLRTVR